MYLNIISPCILYFCDIVWNEFAMEFFSSNKLYFANLLILQI